MSPSHNEWPRRCPPDLRNDLALPPARRHATGHYRHALALRSTPVGPCRSAHWRKLPRRHSSSTDLRRPPLADPRQLTASKPHIDADHAHDHAHTIPLHHTTLYYTLLGLPVAMSMGVRHLRGGEVLRSSALTASAVSGRVAEPDPHHPAASAEPPTTSRGLRAAARSCASSALRRVAATVEDGLSATAGHPCL
jgi:hypothetical protein